MARDGTKTGGRGKGSLNKKTAEERDRAGRVLKLIETKYLAKDIKQLSPHQRTMLYCDMMEYKAPKLSRTEHIGDPEKPIEMNVASGLTFEQLYKLKYGQLPE